MKQDKDYIMRFEPNPDTRLLVDRLLLLKTGEILTYGDMKNIVLRPMEGADPALQSARKQVEREDGFIFSTIRTIGLIRLTDEEIVNLGEGGAKKLRRSARRSYRKVSNVGDFSSLTPVGKAKHNGALALFSGVMSASKGSVLRKLEKAANSGLLTLGQTFELFSDKNK